jgi:hypothetical protein
MARYSPELIAAVRHDYESTDKSLGRIAADHRLSERTVNRMRDREDWSRRSERVRELSPAARALQEATRLLAERQALPPSPTLPRKGGGSGKAVPALQEDSAAQDASAAHDNRTAIVERIERLVARELQAEEAVRAQLGPLPRPAADAERGARTLSTLTQTLHALARLRSGLLPDHGPADDDLPRDIDEFRRGLARRIRLFVQSRTGGGVGGG